jgi:hypothetical protein
MEEGGWLAAIGIGSGPSKGWAYQQLKTGSGYAFWLVSPRRCDWAHSLSGARFA